MYITTSGHLGDDLRTKTFTIQTMEPMRLDEVVEKFCELFCRQRNMVNPGKVEPSLNYFQQQIVCTSCQKLIDSAKHISDELRPLFYLEDLVDFDECPPLSNWAAQDASGVIWFYKSKPVLSSDGVWDGAYPTYHRHSVAQAIDWRNPLYRQG